MDRLGLALRFESREVPKIGKVPTLLWFDRLNPTISIFQKDARTVLSIFQNQTSPIGAQSKVLLNEIGLQQSQMRGDPSDFILSHFHLTWPAAAGGAAVTFPKDWHRPFSK